MLLCVFFCTDPERGRRRWRSVYRDHGNHLTGGRRAATPDPPRSRCARTGGEVGGGGVSDRRRGVERRFGGRAVRVVLFDRWGGAQCSTGECHWHCARTVVCP